MTDQTKKYFEPRGEDEKATWVKHKVQKYTQAGIPDVQFDGGTKKDTSRSADQDTSGTDNPLPSVGMVELPKYMAAVKKAISGVREEVVNEAFPPKKKKSSEEDEDDAPPKDGDADGSVNDDGSEKEEEVEDEAKEDGPKKVADSGAPGSEVRLQLETIALQAAELFAEVDEKQAFDGEIKEALETAVEAMGRVHAIIMGEGSEENDDDKDGDGNADYEEGDDDSGDDQKKPPFQKEEVISEVSRQLVKRYFGKAQKDHDRLRKKEADGSLTVGGEKRLERRKEGMRKAADNLDRKDGKDD